MEDNYLDLSGGLSDLNSFNPELEQTLNKKIVLSHSNSALARSRIDEHKLMQVKNNAIDSASFDESSYFASATREGDKHHEREEQDEEYEQYARSVLTSGKLSANSSLHGGAAAGSAFLNDSDQDSVQIVSAERKQTHFQLFIQTAYPILFIGALLFAMAYFERHVFYSMFSSGIFLTMQAILLMTNFIYSRRVLLEHKYVDQQLEKNEVNQLVVLRTDSLSKIFASSYFMGIVFILDFAYILYAFYQNYGSQCLINAVNQQTAKTAANPDKFTRYRPPMGVIEE